MMWQNIRSTKSHINHVVYFYIDKIPYMVPTSIYTKMSHSNENTYKREHSKSTDKCLIKYISNISTSPMSFREM